MPDKVPEKLSKLAELADVGWTALLFFGVGAAIGLAQLASSAERIVLRLAIARAVTVGGLAMAAGAVLIWLPDTPLLGQLGLAAALASLGTTGLELLLARMFKRGGGQS